MTQENYKPFLSDIEELRRRAREDMSKGAVTSTYGRDLPQAIDILNQVLASEIVCVLRYKRHFFMAQGIQAEPIAQEFLQHANDEQLHADQVALRITQLGGEPNFDPNGLLTRSIAEYKAGNALIEMIKEDLVAETGRGHVVCRDQSLVRRRRHYDTALDGRAPRQRGGARQRSRRPAGGDG